MLNQFAQPITVRITKVFTAATDKCEKAQDDQNAWQGKQNDKNGLVIKLHLG